MSTVFQLRNTILGAALLLGMGAHAQQDPYDLTVVHEVRLRFAEPDWRSRLEALYLQGENARLLADLWVDGHSYSQVGVRFKGYSSYAPGRIKNPFNIKLNEVVRGQNHFGARKLKLSNVTSDPSFLREVLAYAVARPYMPASRAAYANVYVNDTLLGLYTHVEDVGNDFLERAFGSSDNAFFKGNPTTVSLTGENANLNYLGGDSALYYDRYGCENDHGWGELVEFMELLCQEPDRVHEVLNVDRALWMHAFNYALINFDSYVGYAQNYYLYRDDNGLWNPILWDLNMAFASFRLTDASLYWNGFNIPQAITMDPLMHYHQPSISPRPLMRNLFAEPMHRRMYLAHLRTLVEEEFVSGRYRTLAGQLRELIAPHVQADPHKFFSYADFENNFEQTVAGITTYPGIAELMDQRAAYLATVPGYGGHPLIGEPQYAPEMVQVGQAITLTVPVSGADTVFLAYAFRKGGAFTKVGMWDDGLHGDGGAGDGVYGAVITPASNQVFYYVYGENNTAGAFSPTAAAHRTHFIGTRLQPGTLVINELAAANNGQVLNEAGEPADWIELYNAGNLPVSTAGLFLSDNAQEPTRWPLPLRTLDPGEFLLLWADERNDLGELHTNFKLDSGGETVLLAYDDTTVIDRVNFGPQYPISTWGRLPNGTGGYQELVPTPGLYNRKDIGAGLDRPLHLYPNPARNELHVVVREKGPLEIQVFALDGRAVSPVVKSTSNELITLRSLHMGPGQFILRVITPTRTLQQPFILLE